jgi:hypothetical protein
VAALVWILDSLARAIVLSRDLEMIDRALAGRPHPDDLKDINAYIAAKYGRPHGRTR